MSKETLSYPVLLHTEADGSVGVTFPDFPGCVTQVDSDGDALRMAAEVLTFHIEGLLEDGEGLPKPDCIAATTESAGNDRQRIKERMAIVTVEINIPNSASSIRER